MKLYFSKLFICFLLLFNLLFLNCSASNAVIENGSSEYPYLIYCENDMKKIAEEPSACYKFMSDITLSDRWLTIAEFNGVLDGNGYNIHNYKPSLNKTYITSLFGLFSVNNGTIKNLGVYGYETLSSTESTKVGIFADTNSGTIDNCFYIGNINVSFYIKNYSSDIYAGGISGKNTGVITNCFTYGNVSSENRSAGDSYCGGITALNEGSVSNSFSNGEIVSKVNISGTSNAYSGGLAGYNVGKILCSYSLGTTHAHSYGNESYSGGLIGYQKIGGHCSNNYSHSNVSATSYTGGTTYGGHYLGGLIGYSEGIVEYCYSIGNVATYTYNYSFGGLIGETGTNSNINITQSFYANNCNSNGLGTKCTIEEIQMLDTYIGWDFDNIWQLENSPYPTLQNQKTYDNLSFTISNIEINGNLFTINIVNNLEDIQENYIVLLATYDNNNRLIKALSSSYEPTSSGNPSINFTDSSYHKVKAFIWNNLLDIIPHSNVYCKNTRE